MKVRRTMLKSKIHRATVTETNLNYVGSITIDPTLMEKAQILPYEMVHVLNIHTGVRFETYAIEGKKDSGEICLNGAAARLAEPGDKVIILTYVDVEGELEELKGWKPVVVHVDEKNRILPDPEGEISNLHFLSRNPKL